MNNDPRVVTPSTRNAARSTERLKAKIRDLENINQVPDSEIVLNSDGIYEEVYFTDEQKVEKLVKIKEGNKEIIERIQSDIQKIEKVNERVAGAVRRSDTRYEMKDGILYNARTKEEIKDEKIILEYIKANDRKTETLEEKLNYARKTFSTNSNENLEEPDFSEMTEEEIALYKQFYSRKGYDNLDQSKVSDIYEQITGLRKKDQEIILQQVVQTKTRF